MMNLNEVEIVYDQFLKSKYQSLVKSVIKYAINYSRLRVEWVLLDTEGRIEIDEERTRAHNSFISACDALARNMKEGNEDALMEKQY